MPYGNEISCFRKLIKFLALPRLSVRARSPHSSVNTAHCTLHTAHCTLNTAHCTLYTAYCTLCTPLPCTMCKLCADTRIRRVIAPNVNCCVLSQFYQRGPIVGDTKLSCYFSVHFRILVRRIKNRIIIVFFS